MTETLRVDSDGLHLPDAYHGHSGGMVVRAPTTTIQSTGDLPIGDVYPLVGPRQWETDTAATIKNPTALEDGGKVGLKQYGEPLEWYPVEIVADAGDADE